MLRKFVVPLIILVSLGTLHCARQEIAPASAEDAYAELRATLSELDDPETESKLVEEFLRSYPDSEHAAWALQYAVYYRSEPLADPAGAKALITEVLPSITDPDDRFEIGLDRHRLALKLEEPSPLREVAEELARSRTLGYVNHLDVLEAAVAIPDWELVLEHAEAAIAFADPQTFRADYPDDEFSDEYVERAVTRRRGNSLAYKAGALIHLDRLAEALPVLAEGEKFTTFNYVGIPETPLYRYWAEAELRRGNPQQAAELLAPDAIMGNDEAALESLRTAYTEINGGDEGFDSYLTEAREKLAVVVDDFTLPTYDGSLFSLSDLKGKVVVLNFWNPG